jgi:hypothetical protein
VLCFLEYSKVLAREECNKLDLTAGPCHWPIVMIGPGGFLLVVSHLFGWRPGFHFMDAQHPTPANTPFH